MKDFLCSEQMCLLFRQPPFSPVLITEILYIICRGTRIKTLFPCLSYFFFKSRSVKFTQVGWQREAPHCTDGREKPLSFTNMGSNQA